MILFWGARKVIQFQGGIIPSSYIGFSHLFLIPTLVHSWALSRPPPPPRLQVNLVNFYWQFLPSYLCTAFYISLGHLKWNEVKSLSSVLPFTTPWTVADQAPPSMGFSRQEYWSGLPFPPPGDLPNPGIKPGSPALQTRRFTIWATREALLGHLFWNVDHFKAFIKFVTILLLLCMFWFEGHEG